MNPMSLLFFGYFLLLLRYDLTIAGFTFDILFDFAGYLILAKAAAELAAESGNMKKTVFITSPKQTSMEMLDIILIPKTLMPEVFGILISVTGIDFLKHTLSKIMMAISKNI